MNSTYCPRHIPETKTRVAPAHTKKIKMCFRRKNDVGKVKRGRGRPRKQTNPCNWTTTILPSSQETSSDSSGTSVQSSTCEEKPKDQFALYVHKNFFVYEVIDLDQQQKKDQSFSFNDEEAEVYVDIDNDNDADESSDFDMQKTYGGAEVSHIMESSLNIDPVLFGSEGVGSTSDSSQTEEEQISDTTQVGFILTQNF